jgi:hypothetical protein
MLALAACQTTKPVTQAPPAASGPAPQLVVKPMDPGNSLIQTEVSGFSPAADNGRNSIDFSLFFENADAIKSWKVEIAGDSGTQKTFTGTGGSLPATLSWDGRADSGAIAPEGKYVAALSIDYGDAFKPGMAQSRPFVLDITPPAGSLSLAPALFAPLAPTDTLSMKIEASASLAKLDSWTLDIYDPGGNLFRTFSGKWPDSQVIWDGKGMKGETVVSAEDYPVAIKLRDEYGNVGTVKSVVPIDILVIKQADGYRIPNSRVYFKEFSADYVNVAPDLAKQNVLRLDQLAAVLKKFPGYRIRIVGHATMIHWDNAALGKIEQESELIPLSKARAEAIKQALVDRGLNAAMIETEGAGAADPLVPDSDYANRWQNRRTAIFLLRQ